MPRPTDGCRARGRLRIDPILGERFWIRSLSPPLEGTGIIRNGHTLDALVPVTLPVVATGREGILITAVVHLWP